MDKRNVILRDANGFNVDNGRTSHQGVEYELVWQAMPALALSVAGTFARHRYEFSSAIEGGETIVDGDDVDTAPRQVHAACLRWEPDDRLSAEAEWLYVGDYWLDAANAHRYAGHELLNLRGRWSFAAAMEPRAQAQQCARPRLRRSRRFRVRQLPLFSGARPHVVRRTGLATLITHGQLGANSAGP